MVLEGNVHDEKESQMPSFVPDLKKLNEYKEESEDVNEVNVNIEHHIEPIQEPSVVMEESLSLAETEKHLIKKALTKYNGRRKMAADELGISERTLYRKIKEYDLA